jgi:hypothetical protein
VLQRTGSLIVHLKKEHSDKWRPCPIISDHWKWSYSIPS